MAKRTLLVTLEVDIDENLFKLDINREKTMYKNNTEYKVSFVDDKEGVQTVYKEILADRFRFREIKDLLCGNDVW